MNWSKVAEHPTRLRRFIFWIPDSIKCPLRYLNYWFWIWTDAARIYLNFRNDEVWSIEENSSKPGKLIKCPSKLKHWEKIWRLSLISEIFAAFFQQHDLTIKLSYTIITKYGPWLFQNVVCLFCAYKITINY